MTPAVNDRVWDALQEVHDPELDEPITTLGFVTSCDISPEGDVDIVLQLPTPQCAPNFAFLMAADARRVVRRLPEVHNVTVRLHDHYTGAEINGAIDRGEGFTGAFPGETADDELTADLPDVPDARRCVELRRTLGLPDDPDEPAFILPTGQPVEAGELKRWLRTARLMRLSIEVNGGICRSLLRVNRGIHIDDPEEVLT
jgi:metal-sulfur cluster biosynthetic enzyme